MTEFNTTYENSTEGRLAILAGEGDQKAAAILAERRAARAKDYADWCKANPGRPAIAAWS